jgi:hypothetical protein
LIYYCHRCDLIGIGGIANVKVNIEWLEKVFRILNKYKIKAHAFGTLNPQIITKFNWFSCDTTDWLSGFKYRRIFILDKGIPKRIRVENAFRFRSVIEYLGIDYHKLHDNVEKTRLNIRVLKEFENELNRTRE